jgi:hypothetical protein
MSTLGVTILAAPAEPLDTCLASIKQVDQILVYSWDPKQIEVAHAHGAQTALISTVSHELIRDEMQASLATDWVLLLDPDEIPEIGAIESFRAKIASAPEAVVGFWIPYRTFFLGTELTKSFANLRQLRLFRRNRVSYRKLIHESPSPLSGYFEHVDMAEPGIAHNFVFDLQRRFERHLQWAKIEALEQYQQGAQLTDPADVLRAGLREFCKYAVEQQGLEDGCAGLINALMHGWKQIAMLCFLWELQKAPNMPVRLSAQIKEFCAELEARDWSID